MQTLTTFTLVHVACSEPIRDRNGAPRVFPSWRSASHALTRHCSKHNLLREDFLITECKLVESERYHLATTYGGQP